MQSGYRKGLKAREKTHSLERRGHALSACRDSGEALIFKMGGEGNAVLFLNAFSAIFSTPKGSIKIKYQSL